MRREPAPADSAREAKLVERLWVICTDAACQYAPLPGIRGRFETLKLLQRLQRSAFAQKLRAWSYMLPAQEPPHELRRGHRFDLSPQRP